MNADALLYKGYGGLREVCSDVWVFPLILRRAMNFRRTIVRIRADI
jgi:hypothetical protein